MFLFTFIVAHFLLCASALNAFAVKSSIVSKYYPSITSLLATMSSDKSSVILPRSAFKSLKPSSFSHPLDERLRKQISEIPFIETIFRQIFAVVEQTYILDLLSTSVLVGPKQIPSLHHLLLDSCRILAIQNVPDVYVRNNPVPNAYTLAVSGRKPFIVIHSSILDMLSADEIKAVIAHELGHIKCEHGIYISILNLLVQGIGSLTSNPITSGLLNAILQDWAKSAELTCDRAALLVVQNPSTVASVFMKLSGGSSQYESELDLESFLKQADKFEDEKKGNKIAGSIFSNVMERSQTHPLPINRVTELHFFFKSAQYRGLIERAAYSDSSTP